MANSVNNVSPSSSSSMDSISYPLTLSQLNVSSTTSAGSFVPIQIQDSSREQTTKVLTCVQAVLLGVACWGAATASGLPDSRAIGVGFAGLSVVPLTNGVRCIIHARRAAKTKQMSLARAMELLNVPKERLHDLPFIQKQYENALKKENATPAFSRSSPMWNLVQRLQARVKQAYQTLEANQTKGRQ